MTAPNQKLVERVARSIAASIYHSEGLETMNYAGVEDYCEREWAHYEKEAQAALAACHFEEIAEAFRALFEETLWYADCGPPGVEYCSKELRAVRERCETVLAKLDGKP